MKNSRCLESQLPEPNCRRKTKRKRSGAGNKKNFVENCKILNFYSKEVRNLLEGFREVENNIYQMRKVR